MRLDETECTEPEVDFLMDDGVVVGDFADTRITGKPNIHSLTIGFLLHPIGRSRSEA